MKILAIRWVKAHAAYFALVSDIFAKDFEYKCKVSSLQPLAMVYIPITFFVLVVLAPPLAISYTFLLALPWGLRFALAQKP